MSKDLMFSFWVFYGLFCQVVCIVPAPTNISVVCQNFVNVLYWNYSKPTEQVEFLVTVKPYLGTPQTFSTDQTYLDISEYSSDVTDDYFVTVRAHDGQEESNTVANKFTYSKDYVDDNTHKCSVDFPAINTSVHKDVISVFFLHPYNIYEQSSLLEDFTYRITHNQHVRNPTCYEEEEQCTAEIHLEQNLTGKCVELKFEGTVGVLFTTTYKNVCVGNDGPVDNLSYFAAIVGGGVVILFIFVGFTWLLWKKWSKIPKIPEVLFSFMCSQRSTTAIHPPVTTTVSEASPMGHVPLLEQQEFDAFDSPTISPLEKDTTIIPTDTEVVMVPETSSASEEDVNFEESEDYGKSSDYDRPKFLQEMSPGDFTTGYGPRPPVLQV
ncbi:interferon gamma receptor 1-like [Triplophysa rosa]|uniref:Interferon gamma receptor 1-2 n=1 Tax=Triplophysa rosa TaxID=992332 RepID=A0A9W7WNH8_TRIRA|nr:interferon gamma receptor 1-like [Triplophysa rosa]KAI7805477.1 interferon gamma receptor 1-2 [Triplophysa rosa]